MHPERVRNASHQCVFRGCGTRTERVRSRFSLHVPSCAWPPDGAWFLRRVGDKTTVHTPPASAATACGRSYAHVPYFEGTEGCYRQPPPRPPCPSPPEPPSQPTYSPLLGLVRKSVSHQGETCCITKFRNLLRPFSFKETDEFLDTLLYHRSFLSAGGGGEHLWCFGCGDGKMVEVTGHRSRFSGSIRCLFLA